MNDKEKEEEIEPLELLEIRINKGHKTFIYKDPTKKNKFERPPIN